MTFVSKVARTQDLQVGDVKYTSWDSAIYGRDNQDGYDGQTEDALLGLDKSRRMADGGMGR